MRASLISLSFAISFNGLLAAESLDKGMKELLTLKDNKKVDVSAELSRVSDGKILFSLNPQKALIPASTTKLVLITALLSKLGSSFRMNTRLYTEGPLNNGISSGDLIISGDGDPFLVSEEIFIIATELRALGYRAFSGDLVIDNSLFAKEEYLQEQNKGRGCALRAYDAPITALGVNFNAVSVAISPSGNIGGRAYVNFEPFSIKGIEIKNEIRTVGTGKTEIQFECHSLSKNQWEIFLSGQINLSSPVQHVYRSLPNTEILNGELIRAIFDRFGIKIHGKVLEGRRGSKAKLILAHESKSLADLVKSLSQFSSNYMGDVLLKRMAVQEGRQGSFSEGVLILHDFLRSIGIKDTFVLKDGSGLSNQTRLSAGQLNRVLQYAAQDFSIFPDLLSGLPSSGQTGTLKNRFQSDDVSGLKGNIRAKTGTLSDPVAVSALAGFFQHKGSLISFSFIQNGIEGRAQPSLLDLHRSQDSALAYFDKHFKGK